MTHHLQGNCNKINSWFSSEAMVHVQSAQRTILYPAKLPKIKVKQTFTDEQKQKKSVVIQLFVVDCVPQKDKL